MNSLSISSSHAGHCASFGFLALPLYIVLHTPRRNVDKPQVSAQSLCFFFQIGFWFLKVWDRSIYSAAWWLMYPLLFSRTKVSIWRSTMPSAHQEDYGVPFTSFSILILFEHYFRIVISLSHILSFREINCHWSSCILLCWMVQQYHIFISLLCMFVLLAWSIYLSFTRYHF